jgi:hypothetical protein
MGDLNYPVWSLCSFPSTYAREFEDTKVLIRSHNSKKTNNGVDKATQKPKVEKQKPTLTLQPPHKNKVNSSTPLVPAILAPLPTGETVELFLLQTR